ncbi:MAG: glycosyltransferase [Candidatus Moranbacteria bacterium]|nr:glycosyltransferase [Candidatus Moranbacteria bacterium]
MKLLINIPAYNEEKRLQKTLQKLPRRVTGFKLVKIQVINDGSTDQTKQIALKNKVDFLYSNHINRGLGITFRKAALNALNNDFDVLVNIDADGQFNPDDIPKLTAPIIAKQADIVIGSRFSGIKPINMPISKKMINRYGSKMVGYFVHEKTPDLTCGFRAYNRESLLRLNLSHQFTYTQETIIDALSKKLKVKWLPVQVRYFAKRKSKMTKSPINFIFQSILIIIKTIRDSQPLKFFGLPALGMIIASFTIFITVFSQYLYNFYYYDTLKLSPFRTWIGLGSILLLAGIQFLILAFLADMIKSNRKLNEDEIYEQRKFRFDMNKNNHKNN